MPTPINKMNTTTWKTIEIGKYKTVEAFKKAVLKDNKIGSWANDIFSKMKLSKKQTLDLVNISVAELGFENGAIYKDICKAAKEQGLDLCPPETGAYLRMEYKDQPKYEWLVIGMEAIADSRGRLSVFYVGHGDGVLWLHGYYGSPGYFWGGRSRFLFLRRKSLGTQSLDTLPFDPQSFELRIEKLEQKLQAIGKILQ